MEREKNEVMTLELGAPEDAPEIRELVRSAYSKWIELIGREPRPMTVDYDEALKTNRFDLLRVNGRLAALVETSRERDQFLVQNLAVAPAFQHRGFGRLLLAHAEALAAADGLEEIGLYTNRLFAENLQLYGKLGYLVDREEDYLGGVLVHMSKGLCRPEYEAPPAPWDRAFDEARAAASRGEAPIGACVVHEGKIIASAGNRTIGDRDPTAHAEVLVIRAAAKILDDERLTDCDLYVTLEPCAMCAGAISHARLRRLYFAAEDEKGGAVENGPRFFSQKTCHHRPEVYGGIRASEAANMLRDFFKARR